MTRAWQSFESSVASALDVAVAEGALRAVCKLSDGLSMARDGKGGYYPRPAVPQPADFMGATRDNGLVLVEAKSTQQPRLTLQWPDGSGAKSNPQLKAHQTDWLIGSDFGAGVGLLLVAFLGFKERPVYALRGSVLQYLGLEGGFCRAGSIPIAAFREYGKHLGDATTWRIRSELYPALFGRGGMDYS